MITRRDLLKTAGASGLTLGVLPLATALESGAFGSAILESPARTGSVRSLNVVNFLRGVEPRGPMDLMLPLQKQMEICKELGLPVTWLLQYDALVPASSSPGSSEPSPFVAYLKAQMPKDHEVGIWFEMNERHCRAAGVEWRGRPGYEWDHYPSVAFTIGYTAEERVKLTDTFMAEFRRVWGKYPKSVASWNLDSITMAHLSKRYGIDAYAVCRDQIATDGFTIWGAPIAGYYPSVTNCWSPALSRKSQIDTPVFRMLGQDPVYYYESSYPLPDEMRAGGKRAGGPDTMEPVWPSGRSEAFIGNFLDMIVKAPTLGFGYAQLGQENNFGWPEMADAFPRQMRALVEIQKAGTAHVETMGDSGRRFKRAFKETPPQAQVMLTDPFGNTHRVERSIWYNSRFYRANLHLKGDLPFLRDLTVYSDRNPQPFLTQATRLHDVEQRMPAVLDGYHWSKTPGSSEPGAGGFFMIDGERLRLTGDPVVREDGKSLIAELPVTGGRTLHVTFGERAVTAHVTPKSMSPLTIAFEWDPSRATLIDVDTERAAFRWQGLDYAVAVGGEAAMAPNGWSVTGGDKPLTLGMAQTS